MKPSYIIGALVTFALLSYGLYQGLVAAPTEATMGNVQRIFYYHLPSAWVAFTLFFLNFVGSLLFLVLKSKAADRFTAIVFVVVGVIGLGIAFGGRSYSEFAGSIGGTLLMCAAAYLLVRQFFRTRLQADTFAASTAEVGVVFCTVVLLTGPLWARPVWGIWWTWDARLTSTLVLWLIYVSYLVLRRFATGGQTPTLAAALAIFGFADVPIVYLSIRYFRTQHPQPVIGGGQGSGIDPHMWVAVLWNLAAFISLAVMLVWARYKLGLAEHAVEEAFAARELEGDTHEPARSTR